MKDLPSSLVYLIGDSIRGSYQQIVGALFGKQAAVEGPRDNCFDSANIRRRLEEWLAGRTPAALTLNCGLHDVRRIRPDGAYQVPLESYVENLGSVMGQISGLDIPAPIWLTSTPVDESAHNGNREYDRFNADIDTYNAAAAALAHQHGWEIIDVHALIAAGRPGQFLSADGVHLTDEGRLTVAGALMPLLRRRVDAHLGADDEKRHEDHVKYSVGYRLE